MMDPLEPRRMLHAGIPAPAGAGMVQPALAAVADFNGDGQSDLLWRNYVTGQNFIEPVTIQPDSITRSPAIDLPSVANPSWKLIGTLDFNNDNKPDLFWQNLDTGQVSLWRMNGTTVAAAEQLVGIDRVQPGWRAAGFADFNGDGHDDIVWRNYDNQKIAFWLMDGRRVQSVVTVPNTPPANWALEGAADFDGDGHPDLVWRNYATGGNAIYRMNGTTVGAFMSISRVGDGTHGWDIEGTGDFNDDGRIDLIFRNYRTGQVGAIFLGGPTGIENHGEAVLFTLAT